MGQQMVMKDDLFVFTIHFWDVAFQIWIQNRWPKVELSGGMTLTPTGKQPCIQMSVSLMLVRFNFMTWIELDPNWRKKRKA